MLGSSKRTLALIVAGLCSLLIVADLNAGLIRRGQNRRAGIFARRSNNRNTTTVTSTPTGAATSGQMATPGSTGNLSVRGQSPDGPETRTRANAGATGNTVTPPLPPPGGNAPRPQ